MTQLDLDRATQSHLEANIDVEVSKYMLILKKLSIDHMLSNELISVER